MRAMMLGVLLVLLLPATGHAQAHVEALPALIAGDTTRYVAVARTDDPPHVIVFDKTSLRSVNNRPRAWFLNIYPDKRAMWLVEADCAEQRIRVMSIAAYDLAGKRIEHDSYSGPPLDWNFAIPGTGGAGMIDRLCQ
jgi:hypothetical protein